MSREDVLYWLRRRVEELRREIEVLEYLISVLEREEAIVDDVVVSTDLGGVRITLPKTVVLDEVREEYLVSRLNELVGDRYSLIRDNAGRVKGVLIHGDVDEKSIIEVKSILKTIASR